MYNGLIYVCVCVCIYLHICALFGECILRKIYPHFHNQINEIFI